MGYDDTMGGLKLNWMKCVSEQGMVLRLAFSFVPCDRIEEGLQTPGRVSMGARSKGITA